MCRLLGVVAETPTDFETCLLGGVRSLAVQSSDHVDGWGIAVHDALAGWLLPKQARAADGDSDYVEAARAARGRVLVAHVRHRTVGGISVDDTPRS